MTNFRRIAVALLAFVALAGAEAGAYRCVDANGKVSYSDRRCEPGNSTAAVIDRSGTRLPAPAEAASASVPGSAPASAQGSRRDQRRQRRKHPLQGGLAVWRRSCRAV